MFYPDDWVYSALVLSNNEPCSMPEERLRNRPEAVTMRALRPRMTA
jgi:hypothetical protein